MKQLLPYRDNAILAPVATVCCGAAGRYLGMLAGVMGEWTAAEEHFEAALEMDERLHAWPWLAHTKHEFALALTARGRAADQSGGSSFRRRGGERGADRNAGAATEDPLAAALMSCCFTLPGGAGSRRPMPGGRHATLF